MNTSIKNYTPIPVSLMYLFQTVEEFQVYYLFLKTAKGSKSDHCVFNIESAYQEIGDLTRTKAKRGFKRLVDLKIIEHLGGYRYRFSDFFFERIMKLTSNDYKYKKSDELECELIPNKMKNVVEETNKIVKKIEKKVEIIDKKLDNIDENVEDFFRKMNENPQDFKQKYDI